MNNRICLLLVCILTVKFASCANILYLCALPSPSHQIWNNALASGLAARGHNVTLISVDLLKNPPKGVHHIYLEGVYNDDYRLLQKALFSVSEHMNPLSEPINYNYYWFGSCKIILETKGFQQLLQYPNDFRVDLVVYDFTPGACLLPFLHKFKNPPLVSVTAYGNPSLLNSIIGAHQYYSYVPHYYLPYDKDMDIWQRIYNFAVHIVEYYHRGAVINPKFDELVAEKFGPGYPTITEMEQRTAIAFVNTNPTFNIPAPLPENVIPVGGLQIADTKPLPKDLEEFIASANKGAVLFSLGTNIRSSLMDVEKQKILLDAFEQFPDYHFLWKFEEPTIDLKLPKNVIIRPWLPQSDILAHPNIKAFFSHSGMLSTQEAIWRGVPILGMPFAYDQNANLFKSIQLGIAEGVEFRTMTTDTIKEKLHALLYNPKYFENAKKLSARFRDQKEKPLDRAVWWIEWLLRNPNANEFLRSPVLRLGYIVGNSYDVIAIITLALLLLTVVAAKLLIKCFRAFSEDRSNQYKMHSKND